MTDKPEQKLKHKTQRTQATKKTRRRKQKKSPRAPEKIDVLKTISEPVQVTRNGNVQKMPAFEARLRAQIRKATVEKSLKALLHVLNVAEKYEMLMPAPEPPHQGGVLIVPGRFSKEEWDGLLTGNESTAESEKAEKDLKP